jgi:hypothetical protein
MEPIVEVPDEVCQAIAAFLHLFFLSTIFWTNVVSFDIWQTFSTLRSKGRSLRVYEKYAFYAWCGPLALCAVAMVAEFVPLVPEEYKPQFGRAPGLCWFANSTALAFYFFFPASLLILVNIFLFAVTVYCIHRQKAAPDITRHSKGRKESRRFWVYTKLSLMMGLSWASAIGASFTDYPILWYPFILLNSLQGAFIYIMFNFKKNFLCGCFDTEPKHKNSISSVVTISQALDKA